MPDHSSLTKIREHYGVVIFKRFFEQIVQQCADVGLIWGEELHFDGSRVQADAAAKTQVPRFYYAVQQHLQAVFPAPALEATDALLAKYDGTQPLVKPNSYQRKSDLWVSPTDPWATPTDYQELGYRLHYGVDGGRARIIVSCLVTPACIQENTPFLDLVRRTQFRWQLPLKRVVGDTGFGTVPNVVGLEQQGLQAFIPLHTDALCKQGKKAKFAAERFQFDPERNVYICPQGELLHFLTHDHSTQRVVYQGRAAVCQACPVSSQCKTGRTARRIGHSIYQEILDQVRRYYSTPAYHKAMRKRQVWVEPKFGELKQWHLGRRFRLRGLAKVNREAWLHAAGQNIKQLLKARKRGHRPLPPAVARSIPGSLPFFFAIENTFYQNIYCCL